MNKKLKTVWPGSEPFCKKQWEKNVWSRTKDENLKTQNKRQGNIHCHYNWSQW